MKRFFLSGLGLALGCLAVQAQEIRWHAASPRPAAVTVPAGTPLATSAAAVTLGRPTAAQDVTPAQTDPQVRPVAFSQEVPDAPHLVFRAKGSDIQQPLPPGPVVPGDPEPLPRPKPLSQVPAPDKGAGSTDTWGTGLAPWGTAGAAAGTVLGGEGLGLGVDAGLGLPDCCPDGCGDCCCPCNNACCGLPGTIWVDAEYLLWWVRNPNIPPLVTTTGALTGADILALKTANPAFMPGALGQIGTQVLVGGNINEGSTNGARITLGVATPWHDVGFETTFFFLGENNHTSVFASPGFPGIYRPFTDAVTGLNNAEFVAFPGVVSGATSVNYRTNFWGGEANLRYPLFCGCNWKLDLLGGFRFIDLDESLQMDESVTFLVASPANGVNAGDNIQVSDHFGTINHFYGGQVGANVEGRVGRWIFGGTAKVALGDMHEVVNISGATLFSPAAGGASTAVGGLLAQPTNIGTFHQDHFAVVPDIGLKLGYQVTDHLRAYVGYDFMYLSSVVRPGDQVDVAVNTSQLPVQGAKSVLVGTPRPEVLFRQTSFFANGINAGFQYTW
jgi:hypothetical protein